MGATTTTRNIVIKVDAPGVKEALDSMARSMGNLNKTTKSMAGNMGFLTSAFKGWLGYLGARELAGMSDQFQSLENRLKITTKNADDAKNVFEGLTKIANDNYQSIAATGDVYNRFALSLEKVHASSSEVLALTDTLVKTFRVSGSTADETSNAMIQLSQAFSIGVLRGQDLRSVLSQNVVIAKALQSTYGADLFKKAEQGAISISAVLKILTGIQKKVAEDAAKMAPTFGQTLAVAFNKVTVSVGEFSKALELPQKFSSVVTLITDNIQALATLLAGAVFYIAITRLVDFGKAMVALYDAGKLFALSNPYIAAFTAIATVGTIVYEKWDKVVNIFTKAKAAFLEFRANELESLNKQSKIDPNSGAIITNKNYDNTKLKIQSLREEAASLRGVIDAPAPTGSGPLANPEDYAKQLSSLADKAAKLAGPTKTLKVELGELNTLYLTGVITLQEYNKRLIAFDLYKVTREFKEGKNDIFKFHEELRDQAIADWNRQLNLGVISLEQFNRFASTEKLKVLNEQLEAGKIGLIEYTKEVNKLEDAVRPGSAFSTGVINFIESVGTLSQGIAKVTSQAFEHLADTLTDFIKTGKFEFATFTKAILDDITAMIVRAAIVRPIASGILGLIGMAAVSTGVPGGGLASTGASASAYHPTNQFANGGIMTAMGSMPLQKYSSGGIANSPQLAMFGEGRQAEAYVPLPDNRRIPVKMEGGGGIQFSQTIIINGDGTSSANGAGTGQNAQQFADAMKRVALDTIIQQKRPGGALA